MSKSDEEVMAELSRAAEGLLFMSEADYPFEPVHWKGSTEINQQFLTSLTGEDAAARLEIVGVDDFFRVAVSDQNRHTPESRREAERYRQLVRVLKENLAELKVYRLGEINIPVYIVGRNQTGNWLGLSTRVVET